MNGVKKITSFITYKIKYTIIKRAFKKELKSGDKVLIMKTITTKYLSEDEIMELREWIKFIPEVLSIQKLQKQKGKEYE